MGKLSDKDTLKLGVLSQVSGFSFTIIPFKLH